MGIRLNPEAREQFKKLYTEAVKLQVQLYDKLGEIEKTIEGTGQLKGLDDFVREEASNWLEVDQVFIDEPTIKFVLSGVEREK